MVVNKKDILAWIYNGKRGTRLNISHILSEVNDENDSEIIELFRSMRQFRTREPSELLITEILAPNRSRSFSPEFSNAKQRKIEGLIDKGAFEILPKEDVSKGPTCHEDALY